MKLEILVVAALTVMVGAAASCAPDRPKTIEVEIIALAYAPSQVSARVGDTLVWKNNDLVPHTVSDPGSDRMESGGILATESFSIVMTEVGETTYTCTYHPVMTGTINVLPR